MALIVNGTRLEFAGYFFGIEDDIGSITRFPTFDMAVEELRFRRFDGKKYSLVMRAEYATPWTEAKEPDASND